jgi:hypothetical protein
VLAEAQDKVADSGVERNVGCGTVGAGMIIFMWFVVLIGVVTLIKFLSK